MQDQKIVSTSLDRCVKRELFLLSKEMHWKCHPFRSKNICLEWFADHKTVFKLANLQMHAVINFFHFTFCPKRLGKKALREYSVFLYCCLFCTFCSSNAFQIGRAKRVEQAAIKMNPCVFLGLLLNHFTLFSVLQYNKSKATYGIRKSSPKSSLMNTTSYSNSVANARWRRRDDQWVNRRHARPPSQKWENHQSRWNLR